MVATAPRQASQFGHMGVDTGHGPVVETGGGLVANTAAVNRAESGRPTSGGDLGDWAARAHQIKHRAAESSGWGLGTDTAPSTDVVTSSEIDSGNRGLEGVDDDGSRETLVPGVMDTELSATE